MQGEETMLSPPAVQVEGTRDQFLTRSRLSRDKDRAVRGSNTFDQVEDVGNGAALSDNARKIIAQEIFDIHQLLLYGLVLDRPLDPQMHGIRRRGFFQIVVGARSPGLHGTFKASLTCQHDDDLIRSDPFDFFPPDAMDTA